MQTVNQRVRRETFERFGVNYFKECFNAANQLPMEKLETLALDLIECWSRGGQLFVFGNGGSAANAMHLANDFTYLASRALGFPARTCALGSNNAILSCLANDEGYQKVFEKELAILSRPGDLALALSGSGNSPNIIDALDFCRSNQVKSYAFLGFGGGKAAGYADCPIILPIKDMQISEDLQLVIGHLLTRWIIEHNEISL